MKYWLLVMILDPYTGEFLEKQEFPTVSKEACIKLAGEETKKYINKQLAIQTFCVTDDHYTGRSVDPGIPLD